jgi:hypothetical protein
MGAPREVLSANRTYYVRTDGSNANNGLANTASGAFLSVQKAIDAVASIDLGPYAATIQVADGTYTGPVVCKSYVGAGPVTILGNTTTPANVVVSVTGSHAIRHGALGKYVFNGFKVQTTTSGLGLLILDGAAAEYLNVVLGSISSGVALYVSSGATVLQTGPLTIAASMGTPLYVEKGASLELSGQLITLSGTPAFTQFVQATRAGIVICAGNTYTGTATGKQYSVDLNSVLVTFGGTLPGNAAGTSGTGAQVS